MITSQTDRYSFYCDACHSLCYCQQEDAPRSMEMTVNQEGLLIARRSDKLPAVDAIARKAVQTFPTGIVYCSQCHKEWPSVADAMQKGLLKCIESITVQEGLTFREIAIRGNTRLKLVPSESGDAVHCNHCDWRGFIPHGDETCPMCFRKGMLEWQHRSMEEAIPVLGCYAILPKQETEPK